MMSHGNTKALPQHQTQTLTRLVSQSPSLPSRHQFYPVSNFMPSAILSWQQFYLVSNYPLASPQCRRHCAGGCRHDYASLYQCCPHCFPHWHHGTRDCTRKNCIGQIEDTHRGDFYRYNQPNNFIIDVFFQCWGFVSVGFRQKGNYKLRIKCKA